MLPFLLLSFCDQLYISVPIEIHIFYQVIENETVIESGYQDIMITNDEVYYIIALPKVVDYNTMVRMQAYNDDEQRWEDCLKLSLTNDIDTVESLCADIDLDISNIDTNIYSIWALEDICTGSKLRYIIEEVK